MVKWFICTPRSMARTTRNKLLSLDSETFDLLASLKTKLRTKENELVKIALLHLDKEIEDAQ